MVGKARFELARHFVTALAPKASPVPGYGLLPDKKRTTGESLRRLMRPAHNGFEPCPSRGILRCCPKLERYEKFEFSPSGWKPDVLPLNTNSA